MKWLQKLNETSNESEKIKLTESFVKSARIIGLLESCYQGCFTVDVNHQEIERLIDLRKMAKKIKTTILQTK